VPAAEGLSQGDNVGRRTATELDDRGVMLGHRTTVRSAAQPAAKCGGASWRRSNCAQPTAVTLECQGVLRANRAKRAWGVAVPTGVALRTHPGFAGRGGPNRGDQPWSLWAPGPDRTTLVAAVHGSPPWARLRPPPAIGTDRNVRERFVGTCHRPNSLGKQSDEREPRRAHGLGQKRRMQARHPGVGPLADDVSSQRVPQGGGQQPFRRLV
jgi:hypothetical protein